MWWRLRRSPDDPRLVGDPRVLSNPRVYLTAVAVVIVEGGRDLFDAEREVVGDRQDALLPFSYIGFSGHDLPYVRAVDERRATPCTARSMVDVAAVRDHASIVPYAGLRGQGAATGDGRPRVASELDGASAAADRVTRAAADEPPGVPRGGPLSNSGPWGAETGPTSLRRGPSARNERRRSGIQHPLLRRA